MNDDDRLDLSLMVAEHRGLIVSGSNPQQSLRLAAET